MPAALSQRLLFAHHHVDDIPVIHSQVFSGGLPVQRVAVEHEAKAGGFLCAEPPFLYRVLPNLQTLLRYIF